MKKTDLYLLAFLYPVILAFVFLALLAGCHSGPDAPPAGSDAHWGDRSDWHRDDWDQEYFADSDGHKVGYIRAWSSQLDITAYCEDGTKVDKWIHDLGGFETEENAQQAVEEKCIVNPKKDE